MPRSTRPWPHASRAWANWRSECVRAAIRRSAFFLYEPHRPAGSKMAAADASVLGCCDRDWPHRGGRCDPGGRAGPPRRDPADRHVRLLYPAGARADAPGRSLQPDDLERERLESRSDRHRLGRGGFAGAAEAMRLTRSFDMSVPMPRLGLCTARLEALTRKDAARSVSYTPLTLPTKGTV